MMIPKFILILAFLVKMHSSFSQNGVSINNSGNAPHPSSGLDVQFTDRGFLLPRMTTSERDAISSPADGLQIFNTTSKCFEAYITPIWQSTFCGCTAPSAPAPSGHSASTTQIVWNWSAVSGATGYKYHITNDYSTATDLGNMLSYTQTGLSCNTSYTLYVWAYGCGNSPVATLNQSTSACFVCGSNNVSFTYKGSGVTYGTVSGQGGTCWLDRNLGASQVATAYNDAGAYGDLFQWGRGDDGHQNRGSGTTGSLSNSDVPGHSSFILTSGSPFDWRSPQNDNLWQGVSGINNPCPAGWRIPTEAEFNTERLSWGSQNSAGAFASPLKLTAAGYRSGEHGGLGDVGGDGRYATSTINSVIYVRRLNFFSGNAYMNTNTRVDGLSVRCIKN